MAQIDEFMAAISGQESGGDPNVVNRDSGAHGQFQIMPANWGPWAREAGLPANAPKTQANQYRVARYKMEQYHKQFGNWAAVAVAWYAGPGTAAKYMKDPGNPRWQKPQGGYPSIAGYVKAMRSRMAAAAGAGPMSFDTAVSSGAPPGAAPGAPSATADEALSAEPPPPPPPSRVNALASTNMRDAFGDASDLADDDDLSLLEMLYQQVDDDDAGEDETTVGPYNVARLMAEQREAAPRPERSEPSPMLATGPPEPEGY